MKNKIIAVIAVLSALTLTFIGCGAKDNKLAEMESELVQNQGNAQICVYNDVKWSTGHALANVGIGTGMTDESVSEEKSDVNRKSLKN